MYVRSGVEHQSGYADRNHEAYLYGLIIPVLPFALVDRVNLHPSEVQQWIGILLGAYGAGLLVGSRKYCCLLVSFLPRTILMAARNSPPFHCDLNSFPHKPF